MAIRPFDPTFKTLVETAPDDWPVLAGEARAPTEVIDAEVALTGARTRLVTALFAEQIALARVRRAMGGAAR